VAGAVLKTDGAGNGMGFDCARSPPTTSAFTRVFNKKEG